MLSTKQKIYLPFKRLIGIVSSFVGIFVMFAFFWWWILIINIIVTKGHPIFVHKRYGKRKKFFGLLKFRSMKIGANPNLAPADMTEEMQASMETKFGKFLRKTSLDESLQLFNVFIGQMAFIGPRPGAAINEENLVIEREKYNPSAFDVRPGISGLAQVEMKRNHDLSIKAKYDSEYVKKMSFLFDTKLFFMTLFGIFKRNDGAR